VASVESSFGAGVAALGIAAAAGPAEAATFPVNNANRRRDGHGRRLGLHLYGTPAGERPVAALLDSLRRRPSTVR
jgi:hypothetical protein